MPNHARLVKASRSNSGSSRSRMQGSTRKKATTTSKWYSKWFATCVKTDKDDKSSEQVPSPSPQIRDLPARGSPGNRHSRPVGVQQRLPRPAQSETPQATPVPEYLNELPFQTRPTTSLSKWFETKSRLPDVVINGEYPGAPPTPQPRQVKDVDAPQDFARFTSDLQGRTELESHPVWLETKKTPPNHGPSQADTSIEPAEVAAELVVSPCIDLPSKHQSTVAADAPSGAQTAEPFKPYPGEMKVSYVPPQLQAGWASGVPPTLRVGHAGRSPPGMRYSTTNVPPPGNRKVDGSPDSQPARYSWPLVDFDQELFLNSDPTHAGLAVPRRLHPRYQEPRIPSMDFSGDGLEQQVTAMLGTLQGGQKWQQRQAQDEEWHVVVPSRFPPGGNTGTGIHEMEASTTTTAQGYPGSQPRHAVHNASPGPPAPEQSGEWHQNRVVRYHEYNWPRFSDVHQYQDPAEEYSRRYRDRRREMRRGRCEG
ncbi:hypothetical protein A1O3_02394 [Capronia epimyces CBS 606.96]|uniref:Uncharacterized protein n=1 Tax=Capronia epimyces CBS 606.96 TaxID=1182542 RepID=W9Y923_9EURO|nr:uncharacterized protein A1O3_02394 [Capronia epimyces CBS 606.96]EXJ89327.1 hypothetical protein A1O3_02394 [Capronia epimyces CBS 606.96]